MLNAGIILSGEYNQELLEAISKVNGIRWNSLFLADNSQSTDKLCDIPVVSSPETHCYLNDLLFVLDPSFCNYDFLSTAIRNSCHLFIEDTSSLSEQELEQLSILASEGGTMIQVRNDFLNQPIVEKLLSLQNNPDIVDIRELIDKPNFNIIGLLYQNLSLTNKLMQFQMQKVDVAGTSVFSGNPDIISLRLEFTNGSVVNITLSTISSKPNHCISSYVNEMTTDVDFSSNILIINNKSKEEIPLVSDEVCIVKQINEFVSSITKNSELSFGLEAELKIYQLTQLIKQKLKLKSLVS